jgi:hypothetical protein
MAIMRQNERMIIALKKNEYIFMQKSVFDRKEKKTLKRVYLNDK